MPLDDPTSNAGPELPGFSLGRTCPGGAYDGATDDGKHALLTRPPRSPLRYRIGSGGADGALHR